MFTTHTQDNLQNRFKRLSLLSTIAAFSLSSAPVTTNAADDNKTVTVHYIDKKTGEPVTRSADLKLFWEENGEFFLTSEAMTAIDVNSQMLQNVHSYNEIAAESNAEKRKLMLANNMFFYVKHLATQHMDCVWEFMGWAKDPEKTFSRAYGDNWREKAEDCGCTLTEQVLPQLQEVHAKQERNP